MKHYLFVVTTLGGGGAERVVSVLSSELAKTDKVTILAYYKVQEEYDRSKDVNVVYMTKDGVSYEAMNYYHRLTNIRRIIKGEEPDFVIPFLSQVCMQVTVALFGTKFKVIQTVRNDPATLPASKIVRLIRDSFIRWSYKTIVQNEAQKEYFKKSLWKKIFIMPNPVRTDLFQITRNHTEGEKSKLSVISVGRLDPQKNYEMLIKTFSLSEELRKSFKVRIYGEGPSREKLEREIKNYGVTECIQLMGRSTDMLNAYASAELFVMTSRFEGMPNALMEAMASGLPCISTNCPTGPSDLITTYENGILIDVDDVQALLDALLYMKKNHKRTVLFSEKARSTIYSKYTPERIARRFVEICDN